MNVDAMLTADWHIREDQPEAWTIPYWEAQDRTMKWLRKLSDKHGNPPMLIAGDVFDRWKPSPFLLAWALENFPPNITCVPGQHDLPHHATGLFEKCGLNVLRKAECVYVQPEPSSLILGTSSTQFHVTTSPWGTDLSTLSPEGTKKSVLVAHVMTYKRRKPYPGCEAPPAATLMDQMKLFDLIVTGDNHQPFTVEMDDGDQLLVNPGSLMRMRADQIDHKPRVYLWDAKTNTVTPEYIPQNDGAMSREHIDVVTERDERIEAFVERLEGNAEIGLGFIDNLKTTLDNEKASKAVRDIVWAAVEGEE
jgi:DNA repair exonuclease SbcCD nuclease subunit